MSQVVEQPLTAESGQVIAHHDALGQGLVHGHAQAST